MKALTIRALCKTYHGGVEALKGIDLEVEEGDFYALLGPNGAGKTMLINHFLINGQWYLVDLPGYGFAQRGKEGRENIQRIIEDYILEREQLTNLFVLIDCRHEPQKIDLEFMEWLGENEIPFSLIFTKIDKISKGRLQENLKVYQTKLLESWEELPPILLSSSEKKEGRDKILNYIDEINKSL